MPASEGSLLQLQHRCIICISQHLANGIEPIQCGAMLLAAEGPTVHGQMATERQQILHQCCQTM